jgi:hypothetical protein
LKQIRNKSEIKNSLAEAGSSLVAVFKASYHLAPGAVIVLGLVAMGVVWLTMQWAPLMTGSAVLLVLVLALSLFAIRGKFGEALLSLVGGLMSIFAYQWTPERFVAFSIAWVGFALFALLIASIKIAAKNEEIIRQATLRLVGSGIMFEETEKRLLDIAKRTELDRLGPIERAEVIRTFAFRGVPIDLFRAGLFAIQNLRILTKADLESISLFVADFFLAFSPTDEQSASAIAEKLYQAIHDTPVPPEEFFAAFKKGRRLIRSQSIEPTEFLRRLQEQLSRGVDPSDILKELQQLEAK